MSVLEIDHVAIGYSSALIVNDLSVEIPKGRSPRLLVQMVVASLLY